MAILDKLRGKHFLPGPGVTEPPPVRGLKRFTFLLGNHFAKLVYLSLLTLLFSLPIITLPAALCGLCAVCSNLVREGHTFLWDDFWGAFKAGLKHIPIGLIMVILPALAYAACVVQLRFWPIALVLGFIALLVDFYLFPLLTAGEKGSLLCLQTAFGLMLLHPRRTLLLIFPLLFLALALVLGSWGIILLAFGFVSCISLSGLLALYPIFF